MGPLEGYRILEIAGIGPGPFCAMVLSDLGAEVVRIDRKAHAGRGTKFDVLNRGRRSLAMDLKRPEAVSAVLDMVERADGLIEGFRPGVMERLGLGPDVCLERNPKLVFGRMTGWGQHGTIAHAAGHDINYIALSGVLHSIGGAGGKPTPPLNLIGDFGGGGMLLAVGVLAGLLEARTSGRGQVVDAAMTDGSALLLAAVVGMHGTGVWKDDRGSNMLDGGAHFYGTYECADGEYVAVGSIEPQFYALLLEKAGLDGAEWEDHLRNRDRWPELKAKLAEAFRTRTRDEWRRIMEGSDVCFAPVLRIGEAIEHPHNRSRQTFVELDGVAQPAPAPRFSRTPTEVQGPPPRVGEHTDAVLADWGFGGERIDAMRAAGAI